MTSKKNTPIDGVRSKLLFWLAEEGAKRIQFDWGYLDACAKGEEEMWEGLAKKLARLSGGRVPFGSWPKIRKGVGLAKRKTKGANRKNPQFKGYRALAALGMNAYQYAAAKQMDHQVVSYYFNGTRYVPIEFVRQFEQETKSLPEELRMRLEDWPLVRDRATKQRWRFGRPMEPGETIEDDE